MKGHKREMSEDATVFWAQTKWIGWTAKPELKGGPSRNSQNPAEGALGKETSKRLVTFL